MKNTLAPFDLEKALAGEPVVTRSGIAVTEIYHLKTALQRFPVRTVINGMIESHNVDGSASDLQSCDSDLFMAPKPVELFVNIYNDRIGGVFQTKSRAVEYEANDAVSICKLSILNGRVVSAETVHEY